MVPVMVRRYIGTGHASAAAMVRDKQEMNMLFLRAVETALTFGVFAKLPFWPGTDMTQGHLNQWQGCASTSAGSM